MHIRDTYHYTPRKSCGSCSTGRTGGVCSCKHPADLARRGERPAKAVSR